jgi:drug/metabolite transporter (DMT)-like permease
MPLEGVLSVPVLSAFGGLLLLDEAVALRLFVSGVIIIGGIAYTHTHSRRLSRRGSTCKR